MEAAHFCIVPIRCFKIKLPFFHLVFFFIFFYPYSGWFSPQASQLNELKAHQHSIKAKTTSDELFRQHLEYESCM